MFFTVLLFTDYMLILTYYTTYYSVKIIYSFGNLTFNTIKNVTDKTFKKN